MKNDKSNNKNNKFQAWTFNAHIHLIDEQIHNRAEFVCKDHKPTIVQAGVTGQAHHASDTAQGSDMKEKARIADLFSIVICKGHFHSQQRQAVILTWWNKRKQAWKLISIPWGIIR